MKFKLVEDYSFKALLHELEEDYYIEDYYIEEFQNSKYLYKSPVKQIINDDRIKIDDLKLLNTATDIGQIGKLFRDTRFETFWIAAVKDNRIIAVRGVTNKSVNSVSIQPYKSKKHNEEQKVKDDSIEIYTNWLNRLNAEGYLLIHNHPSNDINISQEDFIVTDYITSNIPGFLMGIIVGIDKYSTIDKNFNVKKI